MLKMVMGSGKHFCPNRLGSDILTQSRCCGVCYRVPTHHHILCLVSPFLASPPHHPLPHRPLRAPVAIAHMLGLRPLPYQDTGRRRWLWTRNQGQWVLALCALGHLTGCKLATNCYFHGLICGCFLSLYLRPVEEDR